MSSQRPYVVLMSTVITLTLWLLPLASIAQEAPAGQAARDLHTAPAHPSLAPEHQGELAGGHARELADKHPSEHTREHNQKCGTRLANPSLSHSPKARSQKSALTAQNQRLQTLESPSGKFTLYYALSGSDAVPATDEDQNGVPDYVEDAALAADSSYKKMVLELGYTDPIPDGETYRIDFENMGFYGYTTPSSDPAGTSMSVHHDFVGFPQNDWPGGDRQGALLATIAHEFKHAIQYVDNKWSGGVGNQDWLEMDATMMEETVYDDVNDYYNYLPSNSIFSSPAQATPVAYSHVTWMLYFAEQYGEPFWVDVWDEIAQDRNLTMLEAMTNILQRRLAGTSTSSQATQQGVSTLRQDHTQNHLWHAGTLAGAIDPTWAPSTSEGLYGFEESAFYPKATFTLSISTQTFPEAGDLGSISSWAAKSVQVTPPPAADPTQGVLVRLNSQNESTSMGVGLVARFKDGRQRELLRTVNNQVSTTLVPGWSWADMSDLTMVVVNTSFTSPSGYSSASTLTGIEWLVDAVTLPERGLLLPYPNPFDRQVSIPFYLNAPSEVSITIFDVTGRRVAEVLKNQSFSEGFQTTQWKPKGLASGVYFVRLTGEGFRDVKAITLQRNGQ
ncbi:MAG: T9SS type A sorting domain-containing protein [Balneolaceae bacterium]|nr:T9SS type A sorting domain-containing protein [Balneolaceae bacterium]